MPPKKRERKMPEKKRRKHKWAREKIELKCGDARECCRVLCRSTIGPNNYTIYAYVKNLGDKRGLEAKMMKSERNKRQCWMDSCLACDVILLTLSNFFPALDFHVDHRGVPFFESKSAKLRAKRTKRPILASYDTIMKQSLDIANVFTRSPGRCLSMHSTDRYRDREGARFPSTETE